LGGAAGDLDEGPAKPPGPQLEERWSRLATLMAGIKYVTAQQVGWAPGPGRDPS